MDKSGFSEFCDAMHLIGFAQMGYELSPDLLRQQNELPLPNFKGLDMSNRNDDNGEVPDQPLSQSGTAPKMKDGSAGESVEVRSRKYDAYFRLFRIELSRNL